MLNSRRPQGIYEKHSNSTGFIMLDNQNSLKRSQPNHSRSKSSIPHHNLSFDMTSRPLEPPPLPPRPAHIFRNSQEISNSTFNYQQYRHAQQQYHYSQTSLKIHEQVSSVHCASLPRNRRMEKLLHQPDDSNRRLSVFQEHQNGREDLVSTGTLDKKQKVCSTLSFFCPRS
jgi:hypothetical protein